MSSVTMAEHAGFCYGVKRAVEMAEQAASSGKRCVMLGSLIHNDSVVRRLESMGPVSYTHLDVYKRQALSFGGVNAAIGMIWPLLENNFNIGDRRIRTKVDFNLTEPEAYLYASFSLRVGQAVALALRLGIRFLKLWSGRNQEQTKKEAV